GPAATAAPPPAPTEPAPVPTTAPAPATETRTAASTGGTISVRFAAGTVELLWASPEPGFTTEIVRQDPDRVEVEFVGDGHTSRIRARWVGAAPDVEVTESGG
ncbi:MAG TPA: hypothetical protein VFO65_02990, partial [Acidimicrobiales bacterium]|nr:hypothetical protein [Acidimicrobiales bacterium]